MNAAMATGGTIATVIQTASVLQAAWTLRDRRVDNGGEADRERRPRRAVLAEEKRMNSRAQVGPERPKTPSGGPISHQW